MASQESSRRGLATDTDRLSTNPPYWRVLFLNGRRNDKTPPPEGRDQSADEVQVVSLACIPADQVRAAFTAKPDLINLKVMGATGAGGAARCCLKTARPEVGDPKGI
jgi:hypothetical protein